MIPVLHGVWASGGLAGDFEHIETQTVGAGGAATITFSSIPGTYKHLQIRGISRTTRTNATGDGIYMRLNSDSGSNYASHALTGDGSTATSSAGASTNAPQIANTSTNQTTANAFGAIVIDILDYASTSKNKTIRNLNGYDGNGLGAVALYSALWTSTSAITTVLLAPIIGPNFAQHSTFSLYGIR